MKRATKRSKQNDSELPELPAGLRWKRPTGKRAFQVELDSAPNSDDFSAQERFWEVELSPYEYADWESSDQMSTELLLEQFTTASDKVLDFCKLQIIEQKAVRESGLVGRGFLLWIRESVAEFELQARMLELAAMLKCMGITEWKPLLTNRFVELWGSNAFCSVDSSKISVEDMFRAIVVVRNMQQYLPANLQDKYSMYSLFYRTTLTRSAITSKKMAREHILLEFDRIRLGEQAFRVAGSELGNVLGPAQVKLMGQAFATNVEVCQALTSNNKSLDKVEGPILQHFKMSKPELLSELASHGVDAKLYSWLVLRAARFPSRQYTIGTRAVIDELKARMEEYQSFVYTLDWVRKIAPDLVDSYMAGEFMGTYEELELYAKLKSVLRKANIPDQFDTIWNEMQELATQSPMKWETIRLEVLRDKKDSRGKKIFWRGF
ncbi:hypothetical protein BASA81_005340 [Batrachochytrium salamandrivorans]|nr:hypothetical protein BASA81_005340 [Batrachochytrium salamandrivorans]